MADLIVVVPSRGRPESVRELAEAFEATCTADTEIVVVIDGDDPSQAAYTAFQQTPQPPRVRCVLTQQTGSMVTALNLGAFYAAQSAVAVGFMGDDHRPRTHGWDAAYVEALWNLGTGIVYGDDMLQGRRLPTQCAMTADIIRELGYMAPPSLMHMYVDNFWLALGEQAGCITYLPDVVVEHRHPVAGKAQWDEGYMRVNDPGMFAKDERAFAEYCRDSLLGDVQKVRALRGAAVA